MLACGAATCASEVRPPVTTTNPPPHDHETLARVARAIVAVRIGAIASGFLLLLCGPDRVRTHIGAVLVVLTVALLHALLLLARPQLDVRRNRYAWPVTAVDSIFALSLIGLTGGAASPVTPVLVLIVVGAAARPTARSTVGLTLLIAAAYAAITIVAGDEAAPLSGRLLKATRWPLYLIFTAVLGTSLSYLVEREQ